MTERTQRDIDPIRDPIQADWWATYFDAQYLLEYEPIFDLERDRHEVARLIDVLGLPAGSRILDVPCGQGRHAHLLAEAGYDVDGLDYSMSCCAIARRRGTARGSATRAATCDAARAMDQPLRCGASTSSHRSGSSPSE